MITQKQRNQRQGMTEILNTKVTRPRLRTPFVERSDLLDQLNQALERQLTLVSAPAGFGKTHLVSQWIAGSSFSAGWLSLDEGDNDPTRFMRYLIAIARSLDGGIGSDALAALESPQQYSLTTIMTFLLNDLSQLKGTNVLVLDDYHLITSEIVHELIALMLDHLPESLHLVVITRTDPPLPLARLRAHDELIELRSADLRFTHDETETFLRQSLAVALPEPSIAQLEAMTEGWIVGLRLAALSLQGHQPADQERVIATFTGGHRHIVEYLCSEVLAVQPEPLREFLLQTAFLNRLTAPLCDAVTEREDSDELLDMLERVNLFLIPLDDTRTWFRLHTLVVEALQQLARQRFDEAQIRQLHLRSSIWHETNGYYTEAVEAALQAQAFARAANVIEMIIEPQLVKRNYEYHTLRRWLEQLPDEVLKRHPTLCLTFAVASLFTSDRHSPLTAAQVHKYLKLAEDTWTAENSTDKLGELLAFRSLVEYWQGEYGRMFETSRQALALLSESQAEWRAILLLNLALQRYLSGDNAGARRLIQESDWLNKAVGNEFAKRSSVALLGLVALSQGSLYEAEQLFLQLHDLSAHQPRDRARALVGLATVAFERNELDQVEPDLMTALEIAGAVKDKHVLVEAAIMLARLKQAQGDTGAARQRLQTLAVRVDMGIHARLLRAWDAWLALMSGDVMAANAWHLASLQNKQNSFPLQEEFETLVIARLLIAQGKTEAALKLLEQWHERVLTGARARSELEILILKALAHYVDRSLPRAKAALLQAMEFAYKAGYVRPFVQEGETVAALLRNIPVGDNLELASFSHGLLRDLGQDQAVNEVSLRFELLAATDPLSPQEQRVFLLIAEGQSNPEIADALGVSINTIKTQVKNIYSKLNINTRRQAREMARALNLV